MAELLVNIDVDDLEKAVAFYEAAFGLTVGRRFGAFGVELLGASSALYLLLKEPGTRASPATDQRRDYGRHWTPVHLDVVVADVEAAVARAEQAGGACEGEIQTHGWGRIAHMADPFGHGFCLIQFLGRGYDEIASTPDPGSDSVAVPESRRSPGGNTDRRSHPPRTWRSDRPLAARGRTWTENPLLVRVSRRRAEDVAIGNREPASVH